MRQGDSLKDFIRQHREEFENEGPSPKVWEALALEVPTGRKQGKLVTLLGKHWLKVAASVILLVNVAFWLHYIDVKKTVANQNVIGMIPGLQEAQFYYSSQIQERLDIIHSFPAEQLGLDSTALKELELRNDTYLHLKEELEKNPGNERIRAAMIRYYQLKLELLDHILAEQQKFDSTKKLPHASEI